MDIHSHIASIALGLIVILLLVGLWLLLLRVLKLPWSMKSVTSVTPDQATRLTYLSASFVALLAGALWIVAWITAQFTEEWGITLLIIGVVCLVGGLRSKPGQKS